MDIPSQYIDLMLVIRKRLDAIRALELTKDDNFFISESVAFNARKIVEAVAFASLMATDNSLKSIPRKAKGQYNAEKIFKTLRKNNINALPNPSIYRVATEKEKMEDNLSAIIEGQPDLCLTYDELIAIYQRLHNWSHELNPYVKGSHDSFNSLNSPQLWKDIGDLENMLTHHLIVVRGVGFYCTLRDQGTNEVKMISISKVKSA